MSRGKWESRRRRFSDLAHARGHVGRWTKGQKQRIRRVLVKYAGAADRWSDEDVESLLMLYAPLAKRAGVAIPRSARYLRDWGCRGWRSAPDDHGPAQESEGDG